MKPAQPSSDDSRGGGSNPIFDRMRAEHVYVLDAVGAIEGAMAAASARGPFPASAVRTLTDLLAREFTAHASAEDDVLIPMLAGGLPGGPPAMRQLVAEHAELRAMLAAFQATLARPGSAARDEQLFVQGRDLTALMRSQIRKEETLVFAIAERAGRRPHRPTRMRPTRGNLE